MISTGVDIVKISRIRKDLENPSFVERVFSDSELRSKENPESLAGIFALKEAFFKATQIKIKRWNEITVKFNDNGKPYLVFNENLIDFKIISIDCSYSHDGEYAIGQVVILF